jgi:hypothetical protein
VVKRLIEVKSLGILLFDKDVQTSQSDGVDMRGKNQMHQ